VAEWTAPSAPRAVPQSEWTGTASSAPRAAAAAVVNPVQVWSTLVGNLFALQRKTWANFVGVQRSDNN